MIDRGFYYYLPARNRHCEKAFSADEAILQRSLTACALRLFIFAVAFKGLHELTSFGYLRTSQ
ncbi:hypothetical protein BCL90_4484 [Pedobacter alluvionis]|uniref:Uncharacterized protein n=1 Tax=Pedobacter alluvionis TaxID=475253 RepID=A0A497XTT2_9SPHI|nr:hypothetical protein BCL90_4484 [Pedobacter alluvionis]